jgi:hypothetical protein
VAPFSEISEILCVFAKRKAATILPNFFVHMYRGAPIGWIVVKFLIWDVLNFVETYRFLLKLYENKMPLLLFIGLHTV